MAFRCSAEEVGGREDILARLGQARRLAKDYERLPESAVAMIYWAMRAASCSAGSSAQPAEMPQEGLGRQL